MLALVSFALALVQQVSAAPQAPLTAEALLPDQTLVVLRAKSLDRLAEIALPFQQMTDANAEPIDLLALVAGQMGVHANWELIDHKRPVLFAVSNSKSNQPAAFTLIAAAQDAAALAADPSWKHSGWTCTPHGDLVVLATEPSEAKLAPDSPLRVGLDSADLVVRVDFQEVMAQFGEEIRGTLNSDLADPADESQVEAARGVFDKLFGFADSIETVGIAVHGIAERTRLEFELTGLPGTPLVDVPKVDTKPLESLVRSIDPAAPFAFVGAMDFAKLMQSMESLVDLGAMGEPAEAVAAAREAMRNAAEMYASMGPCSAGGVRLGKGGMSFTYALRPTDVKRVIGAYTKMVQIQSAGVSIEGPTLETIAGHEVQRFRIKMNPDQLPGMTAADAESEAARGMFADMMEKFFGSGAIPISFTPHEGTLIVNVGRDDEIAGAIARVSATTISPAGSDLLSMLGTLNPGFAMRLDTPAFVSSFIDLGSALVGKAPRKADEAVALFKDCAPLRMTFGLDQRTWRVTLDADAVRMAKAFMGLQPLIDETVAEESEDGMSPK